MYDFKLNGEPNPHKEKVTPRRFCSLSGVTGPNPHKEKVTPRRVTLASGHTLSQRPPSNEQKIRQERVKEYSQNIAKARAEYIKLIGNTRENEKEEIIYAIFRKYIVILAISSSSKSYSQWNKMNKYWIKDFREEIEINVLYSEMSSFFQKYAEIFENINFAPKGGILEQLREGIIERDKNFFGTDKDFFELVVGFF